MAIHLVHGVARQWKLHLLWTRRSCSAFHEIKHDLHVRHDNDRENGQVQYFTVQFVPTTNLSLDTCEIDSL
jgi:hypothetical protein